MLGVCDLRVELRLCVSGSAEHQPLTSEETSLLALGLHWLPAKVKLLL